VQLVLDENASALRERFGDGTDFSDIVNVTIYIPMATCSISSRWSKLSLATPVASSIVLSVSNDDSSWVSSLTTGQTSVWLRATVLDQYGNAYANQAIPQLKVQVPGLALPLVTPIPWTGATTDSSGVVVPDLLVNGLTPGAAIYQIRAWIDGSGSNPIDNAIQSTETQSNLVPVTVTP